MKMTQLTEITDTNLKHELINNDIPVLLDCWAEWCVPCKAIEPSIKDIADIYAGRLKVAKLNVDRNMETAAFFRITSLPTMILWKDGRVAASLTGAVHKKKIIAMIEKQLNPFPA